MIEEVVEWRDQGKEQRTGERLEKGKEVKEAKEAKEAKDLLVTAFEASDRN